MTFYLMAIIMFAVSMTFYEIIANEMKCKKLDLDNDGQG